MTASPTPETSGADPGTPGGSCTRRPGYRTTGCRCSRDGCRRSTVSSKERRRRAQEGEPGRVPAGPVRHFVRVWLHANPTLTNADLARLSGVSRRTIGLILAGGHDRTVNRTTAAKLTRTPITPNVPPPPARPMPGVGTRRRVEALMTQGWPVKLIATTAGLSPATLIPTNLSTGCSARTAAAVRVVFDLWRYQLGPSPRTARMATRRGYLPWQVWNGRIDDPIAYPDLAGLPAPVAAAWRARRSKGGVVAA